MTLRETLRAATRADHDALDAFFADVDFDDPASYAWFLRAQAPAVFAIETALDEAGFAAHLADWPTRRRSEALRADLAALGAPAPSPAPAPVLRGGAAALFGAAYVTEGSRLGAAMLARRAEKSADPSVRAATGFLTHGAGRRLWPDYLAALEAGLDDGGAGDAAAGAAAVFTLFLAAARATPPLSRSPSQNSPRPASS